jgi:hypothetical protein
MQAITLRRWPCVSGVSFFPAINPLVGGEESP